MPTDMFSPKNTKSKDFHIVFTNALGFQFTGSEMIIRFSVIKNIADENDGVEEQVAVAMTASTAKVLMHALQQIISSYEATN